MVRTSKVKQALVLAAGEGSRLKNWTKQKALYCIAGFPLLGIVLGGLHEAGIENVVIVVGYEADNIRQEIGTNYLGLDVSYVVAKNWKKGNLHSFLAAKEMFTNDFVLCTGDHIFDSQIVKDLISFDNNCSIVLAIDRVGHSVDDTKVLEHNGSIINIGTDIMLSNGVNTGFFVCSPKMFFSAETVAQQSKPELDDYIRLSAKNNDTQTLDITGHYGVDVDNKTNLERAKTVLAKHSHKET